MMTQEEWERLQNAQAKGTADQAAVREAPAAQASQAPVWEVPQHVLDAQQALAQWQQSKPQEYQSSYADTIDSMLQGILNREPFQYDMNADPLYQQYKDYYVKQGNTAMRDTMGQAAALTGGYGNSYANIAGNLAYQNSLGQLNSIVPELYGQAASQYTQQGQQMASNLGALQNQENAAYSQHQADLQNYYTGLNAALTNYNTIYGQEYGRHQDDVAQYQAQQALAMQQAQADQAQANALAALAAQNKKPLKAGYTTYQLAMALNSLYQGEDAALAYIDQLGLSKSARTNLLRALGLYGSDS